MAFDLLLEQSTKWWNVNPMTSVTNFELTQSQKLFVEKFDLLGFIDGSYKNIAGVTKSGIGGMIQTRDKKIIFIFSGPVITKSLWIRNGRPWSI